MSSYFMQADRTIHFQHCQRHLVQAGDSVLPQRLVQFVQADVLPGHVGGNDLAIVDQQAGLALDQFAEAPVPAGKFRDQVVEQTAG